MPCPILAGHGWCGLCYANCKGRSNYKGHRGYHKSRNDRGVSMAEFLRRNKGHNSAVTSHQQCSGCPLSKRFPALVEFLTVGKWDDGAPRTTGTMLVLWEDGRWRAMLNDRNDNLTAWLSSDTLEGLLASLEAAVADGAVEWRRPRKWGGKK